MKLSATELVIHILDAKIATLQAAKQHILDARAELGAPTNGEAEAPKKRGRKKKGLPLSVHDTDSLRGDARKDERL